MGRFRYRKLGENRKGVLQFSFLVEIIMSKIALLAIIYLVMIQENDSKVPSFDSKSTLFFFIKLTWNPIQQHACNITVSLPKRKGERTEKKFLLE